MDWALFLSTFVLIFLGELPDKTAFATLLMATKDNPWAIFIGAAAAFVVQSLVAVCFGSLFALLPQEIVKVGSALLFFVFAYLMWAKKDEDDEAGVPHERKNFWNSVWKSFVVIFIAEWGDITQLATATLVAKHAKPVIIFVAATLALWSVTGLAIVVGNRAKTAIRAAVLQRIAAIAFALVGIYLLVEAYQIWA
jgi:Ca2+/H+ antiporter, TMEM165/GDT1 family